MEVMKENDRKTLYMVLGMHRSGTSLTVQLLNKMNVWVGEEEQMLPKDQYNERGYWEIKDLVQMDDLLISKAQKTWYSLTEPILDNKLMHFLMNDFAKQYLNNEHENIAIKDPRLSIIWKQWITEMPYKERKIRGIIVVRNPFEVAESLSRRDQMNPEYAMCVWFVYNWSCLLFSLEYDSMWMDYADYFEDYEGVRDRIWSFVYGKDAEKDDGFITVVDGAIRHHKSDGVEPSTWIMTKVGEFYLSLKQLANGEVTVSEVVDEYMASYEEIRNWGLELCCDVDEKQTAKQIYLENIGRNPRKYWRFFLDDWLKTHSSPLVLCGNGKNLEKLLPLLETHGVEIAGIFDNYNFKERAYGDRTIKIWSFEEMKVRYRDGDICLITPFYANEQAIWEELCDIVDLKKIYRLSHLLR